MNTGAVNTVVFKAFAVILPSVHESYLHITSGSHTAEFSLLQCKTCLIL